MIPITIRYQGDLRCEAVHNPSARTLHTDAPVDNNGKGESFSPTDLVATALGSCMATVMGIISQRKEVPLHAMRVEVRKFMSDDAPRRISRLEVDLHLPLPETHEIAPLLMAAARGCPVHQSLHPDIVIDFQWHWAGASD